MQRIKISSNFFTHLRAAQNVKMQVRYRLTCMRTTVGNDSVTT